jgi:hypothetical protein
MTHFVLTMWFFYANDTTPNSSMACGDLPTNRWTAKLCRKPAIPGRSLGTRGITYLLVTRYQSTKSLVLRYRSPVLGRMATICLPR